MTIQTATRKKHSLEEKRYCHCSNAVPHNWWAPAMSTDQVCIGNSLVCQADGAMSCTYVHYKMCGYWQCNMFSFHSAWKRLRLHTECKRVDFRFSRVKKEEEDIVRWCACLFVCLFACFLFINLTILKLK